MGFAGLKTMGHHAFFGIGAYASAILAMKTGWSPWVTVFLGAAMAGVAGCLVGTPLFRIRSMAHVAIVTLAFAEIVRLVLSNLTDLTRGEMGLWGIPPFSAISLPFFGLTQFGPANKVSMYYVVFAICLAVHLVILAMIRSRIGLALVAMREGPDAAQSLGVNLTKNKLLVFGVSALLVGLMGGFYAHYIAILTPMAVAGPEIFILVFAMVLVGGIGTFIGPIIGAFLLTLGVELLRPLGDYRLMIYGALVVLIMLFMPNGLATLVRSFGRGRAVGGPERPATGASGPIEGVTNET